MPSRANVAIELYESALKGTRPRLPVVAPYGRFIKWLEERERGRSRAYWREFLKGIDQPSHLPDEPGASGSRGAIETVLGAEETAAVRRAAARIGVTLNTAFEAAWAVVLSQLCGRGDVVFLKTVSGRPAELEGAERMIGLFINTVPARAQFRRERQLRDLMAGMQRAAVEGMDHHHVPISEIIAPLALPESPFDHVVVFENYPFDRTAPAGKSGLSIADVDSRDERHFGFGISIFPAERMLIRMSFDPAKHTTAQAEQIARRLRDTLCRLESALEEPLASLMKLPCTQTGKQP